MLTIYEVIQRQTHLKPTLEVHFYSLPFIGKMSDARAVRKQQQLNNLVAMVTEMARPVQTVVDFCSGGVGYFVTFQKKKTFSFCVASRNL